MQLPRNRVFFFFWQFPSHHKGASKGSMQHSLLLNFSFLTTEMYVFNYKGDTGEPNLSFATPLWFSEFSPCSRPAALFKSRQTVVDSCKQQGD